MVKSTSVIYVMIKDFGSALLRTHILPFTVFFGEKRNSFLEKLHYDISFLKELNDNQPFLDALFFSSKTLYQDFHKLVAAENIDLKFSDLSNKQKSVFKSVLKYYIRMSSRCTPFGLSAGIGMLTISNEDFVRLADYNSYKKKINFDYQATEKLINRLKSQDSICMDVNLYTNNTLHRKEGNIFYVTEKDKVFKRVVIKSNQILDLILSIFIKSQRLADAYEQLNKIVIIEKLEFKSYILELVEYGLIIEDLYPDSICDDQSIDILRKLEGIKRAKPDLDFLKKLQKINDDFYFKINKLKHDIYKSVLVNEAIDSFKVEIGIEFENNTLSKKHVERVIDVIKWLTVVKGFVYSKDLEEFKEKFLKRYGNEKIPILEALDDVEGIRYPINAKTSQNSLYDKEFVTKDKISKGTISLNDWDTQLLNKYIEFCSSNVDGSVLELTDNDFGKTSFDLDHIPTSLYACFSVIKNDYNDLIDFQYCGTNNSLRLISRYTHINDDIRELAKSCLNKEEELHDDVIFAEIGYSPRDNMANVNTRPDIYKYYIPIFSHSRNGIAIPLDDLFVYIEHGQINLFSKKIGKKVIPTFSTAYNYKAKSFGLYNFLSELSFQNSTNGIYWNWGSINILVKHKPRVVYKDIILSKESWLISKDDLKNDFSENNIDEYLERINIDFRCNLKEGNDNFLFVDLKEKFFKDIFIEQLSKKGFVELEENIFDKQKNKSLVASGNEETFFCNEIILPLYKSKYNKPISESFSMTKPSQNTKKTFLPRISFNERWSQVNLFMEFDDMDRLLINLIPIRFDDKFDFFFIRYDDPSPHLRLRVRTKENTTKDFTSNDFFNMQVEKYFHEGIIKSVQIDSYSREIEVYNSIPYDSVEKLFVADSNYVLLILKYIYPKKNILNIDFKITLGVLICYKLLKLFSFNDNEQLLFVHNLSKNHKAGNELEDNVDNKKKFSAGYSYFHDNIHSSLLPLKDTLAFVDLQSKKYSSVISEISALSYNDRSVLAERILHLSCNRLIDENLLRNEMIIHDLLLRLLKQKDYISNQQPYKDFLFN